MRSGVIAAAICLSLVGFAHADDVRGAVRKTAVPAQALGPALQLLAKEYDFQVLYRTEVVGSLKTQGVSGAMTAEQALEKVLSGTGLTYKYIDEKTVTIIPSTPPQASPQAPQPVDTNPARLKEERMTGEKSDRTVELEEVVVTGTYITGPSESAAPVSTYSRAAIEATGATTIAQFLGTLPQNANVLSGIAPGANGSETNSTGAAGVDLRGLGVGTTLVLVNGQRMAPASNGRTPDISMIPLSAIDRIDVLTDGASAIYGSDAVGGVVNIILRSGFDGVETHASYGTDRNRDTTQTRLDVTGGGSWNTGRALLSLSDLDNTRLDASERSYSRAAAPFTLVPSNGVYSAVGSLQQSVANELTLFASGLVSSRRDVTEGKSLNLRAVTTNKNHSDQTFLTGGTEYRLAHDFRLGIVGTYSSYDVKTDQSYSTTAFRSETETGYRNIETKLSGAILELPAGAVQFASGGGYSRDSLSSSATNTTLISNLSRASEFAYSEFFVPLVFPAMSIPAINRLSFDAAGRFTHYSDFGGQFVPKLGLTWAPVGDVTLSGTFSKSFRAPDLPTSNPNGTQNVLFPLKAVGYPDSFSTDQSTVMYWVFGSGNPNLRPEKSTSYTVNAQYKPVWLDGFVAQLDYWNVRYSDRIAKPDPSGGANAIYHPADFLYLYTLHPTAAQIAAVNVPGRNTLNLTSANIDDPDSIASVATVMLNTEVRNLALSAADGLDIELKYAAQAGAVRWNAGLNGAIIINSTYQLTSTSSPQKAFNTVGTPAGTRLKGYVALSEGGFSGQLNANYIGGYKNTVTVAAGPVASWTTFDLATSYAFGRRHDALSGIRIDLSVLNLFDRDPPFVPVGTSVNTALNAPIGFDPTNANPLGRFISIGITKEW
jgi:iron complex outermembrane recepter protein